ncbi:MAG TPA: hypothetical protein DCM73_00690 [Clostridiales bacterium]|nr:hypothetical protein [Clostridiales bacterium]
MVSTKWMQGIDNISAALEIRKKVFYNELQVADSCMPDIYDEFAFSVVVYEDDIPAGTGRLLFKDGKYIIDNLCVLRQFRGKNYGDLIIRMLVRKGVNMGSKKTYAEVDESCAAIFKNIGFEKIKSLENGRQLMMKEGDVGGHCS